MRKKSLLKPLVEPGWKQEWQGMPEFVQESVEPFKTLIVKFKSQDDVDAFAKLVEQNISETTKYLWYPKLVPRSRKVSGYVDES